MSMNTRDERLYHYEYRRPRYNNPTYNSSHVFDSLHMMIRPNQPTSNLRSYGCYSLEGNESLLGNRSEVVGARQSRPIENNSGKIKLMRVTLPPREGSRQARQVNDRDSLYLQMVDQKNRVKTGRSNGFDMGSSHLSENAENQRQPLSKGADSLSREVREFDSHRR